MNQDIKKINDGIKGNVQTYDSVHDLMASWDTKDTKWSRFVDKLYVIKWKITYAWEKVYCRYFGRKHHLINTKLPPAYWYDTDGRMLYGMMSLLEDYVEKEKPFEYVAWDEDDDTKNVASEIKTIYAWWKNYPQRQKEIDAALDKWYKYSSKKEGYDKNTEKELLDANTELERKILDEEQDMLIRLVKIRGFLWV